MTTKIIVPCVRVGEKYLRHRWRWGNHHHVYTDETSWERYCLRCGRWWNDVHAAYV